VVKEPQEMSVSVQNYPETNWQAEGMPALRVGMVLTLVATIFAGILSNPLFTLSIQAVEQSPFLGFPTAQAPIPESASLQVAVDGSLGSLTQPSQG